MQMRGHNVLTYYPYEHEDIGDEQGERGILDDRPDGDGDLSMVCLNERYEGGEDDEIIEERGSNKVPDNKNSLFL